MAWGEAVYVLPGLQIPLCVGIWFSVLPLSENGGELYGAAGQEYFLTCYGDASEKYGGKRQDYEVSGTELSVSEGF